MKVELSGQDLDTLLSSLEYSQKRIASSEGTPYAIRAENLSRTDCAIRTIRRARNSSTR